MDLSKINLLQLIQDKMGYLSQRQAVLAENISNIDTPGYRPKDIEEPSFLKMAMAASGKLGMTATNPSHMPQADMNGVGMLDPRKQRKVYEIKPVGNSVVLEEQMKKEALTSADYSVVTSMYKKIGDMLKLAASNR